MDTWIDTYGWLFWGLLPTLVMGAYVVKRILATGVRPTRLVSFAVAGFGVLVLLMAALPSRLVMPLYFLLLGVAGTCVLLIEARVRGWV